MKKRNLILVVLLALVAATSIFVGNTYAKYVSAATGTTTVGIAKWDIQVNGIDMTSGSVALGTTINCTFSDEMPNAQIISGKIAPGRSCYFDIAIDPTGTEVGITYAVSLGSITNLPANMTTSMKYSTGGTAYAAGTAATLEDGAGSIALPTGLTSAMATAQKTYVRVSLTWPYETSAGAGDVSDTVDGIAAATISVPVTVRLTQTGSL